MGYIWNPLCVDNQFRPSLKKISSQNFSLEPSDSLPPVWPLCSSNLANSARPHFHLYFWRSCSIIFLKPNFYQICRKDQSSEPDFIVVSWWWKEDIGCKMQCGNSLVLVESRGLAMFSFQGWTLIKPKLLLEVAWRCHCYRILLRSSVGKETITMQMRFLLLRNHFTEEVMYRLGGAGDPLLLQRRARMMDTYTQLQQTHPALPSNLRDFQVQPGTCLMPYWKPLIKWQVQADITAAAIDQQDRHHILSCLPTGMGKTLPMLLTARLLPPGDTTSGHMHK